MKTKISKLLITLLVITLGTVYASNTMGMNETKDYKKMSTTKLQIEVERLSLEDKLPFEMGLELIHRWSDSKKEIN